MLQRIALKRWTNSSSPSLYIYMSRLNHLSTLSVNPDCDSISSSPPSKNWTSDNELFNNYPRLHFLQGEKCKSLNQLNQIFSYIFISGLHHNSFIMSRVIFTCLTGLETEKNGGELRRNYAALIFSQIQKPNIFTWNTMIRAFSNLGNSSDSIIAFSYYVEMIQKGFLPDKYTYPFLLQVCGSNSDMGFEKQIHAHALVFGLITDLFVQNGLLNAYFLCGSITDASNLFDEMTDRDVVSWTTLISGFSGQGFYEECLWIFRRMMVDELVLRPNVATVVSLMAACANLGSLDHTKSLHSYLVKAGWVEVEVSVRNSLIDAYSKCGSVKCAEEIFHEIKCHRRDTCCWTTIISCLAMHGFGAEAIKIFSQMKRDGLVMPDSVTFIAVLSACAHGGLIDEGTQIFESMEIEYGIVPQVKHYGCMVDLFGRAGLLEEAYSFMKKMPMESNLVVLGSLLSACRVHDNVKLGEDILKRIECSCEYRGGANVLMSNMYANKNRWNEVVDVREGLKGEKLMGKPPGRSWIEVKGLVHEFVIGDESHPQANELYMLLEGLTRLSCLQ